MNDLAHNTRYTGYDRIASRRWYADSRAQGVYEAAGVARKRLKVYEGGRKGLFLDKIKIPV